ncbi:hypothetical protein MTR67_017823 [Solanum verrucosum]|uniref:Uncharacterized protein n=1 Tax=Solanum verrucosum TaxID=315347 RepID=A0AAF0QL98_SOLVR|nr:hypothetical protein MTR67_017823 [Solanum verrucosum]
MNQSAILKKKGLNPTKAQSPLKNLDFDMPYRSSAKLANKFKIKREQLANERNDRAKKDQAPIPHKRKNSEDFISQQEKGKLLGHKSVIKSSSREELSTSHMIAGKGQTKQSTVHVTGTTLGNREVQHDIEDLLKFKQVKRKSVRPATGIDQFLDNQRIHNEHDNHDLPNCKQVKRKSVIPSNSLDQFQKNQGIRIDDETKRDNHTIADVEFMHAHIINEHNKGLDDLVDQEELSGDECDVEEEIDIDCSTKEISKPKKVRGQTKCKDIHARNLEERKEVTFDKGQAVGPTNKIVSKLSNFIGTIARNPRFISLMYTSWHAVPIDTKKRMWEYINSKFLIPVEGKKWVMTDLRDAWRRHKKKIKENFFYKNSTLENMLAKRPDSIPDNQFRQLIEYWKNPTVQAICEMNSQNRKKQKWRHRMGPINFARVRVALRAAKDDNEEPSKSEMFIATRTKTRKEIQADTQVAIAELHNRQNSGETTDDAFRAMFGKEQPGDLGAMEELREEMRHLFTQLLQNNPGLNFQDIPGCVGSNIASPIDASSAQAVRGTNLPHSSRCPMCCLALLVFLFSLYGCGMILVGGRIWALVFVDGVLNLPWSFGIAVEPFG